jgi:hypothetical protein
MAALFAVLLSMTPGLAQVKDVKAADEIRGKFTDDKDLPKMKALGNSGVIADEKEFAKLWKEWKGDAPLPKIDFKKQFAIGATTLCAANSVSGSFALSPEGDLKSQFRSTLIGGPGFAWVIYVIDREGVKTVGGKPLPGTKE